MNQKERIFAGLIIINFIILVSLIANIYFSNDVQIVVREETTPNLINENIDSVCPRLCEGEGYNGWTHRGGTIRQTTSCDCYWLVKSVPKERI